jgi:Rrf2 family protein
MRLEVSGRADLAVRALLVLTAAGQRLKAAELSARLGSTPTYIPQVLKPLVDRGWIRSDPGPAGGYACVAPLDGLSVLAVIEAVEGPTETGRCVLETRPCDSDRPCVLHGPWQAARAQLLASLAATPLASLPADVDLSLITREESPHA